MSTFNYSDDAFEMEGDTAETGRTQPRVARRNGPEYRRKHRPTGRVGGMHCRRNKRWTWGHGRGARLSNVRAFAGCLAATLAASLVQSVVAANGFTLLPVGDAGQGGVNYDFQISAYETTNAQYVDFLNSIDAAGTNPNNVYSTRMASDPNGGIDFDSGAASGAKYAVKTNFDSKPVNFVSWGSAARFVNWLTNGGTPTSDTELGSYNLANPSAGRVAGGYVLPSQEEWYKAAFFNGSGFNTWATNSNTQPDATVVDLTTPNSANYGGTSITPASPGPLEIGSYTATTSPYGLYDMMGNVMEYTDTMSVSGTQAQVYGASWNTGTAFASSWASTNSNPIYRNLDTTNAQLGFRVAVAPVPEPGTVSLAIAGGLGLVLAGWAKRRRIAKPDHDLPLAA